MKKYPNATFPFLFLFIAILLSAGANAQSWSYPKTLYSGYETEVTVSYKISSMAYSRDCEDGYSYYKLYNRTACPKCYIRFKFDYIDCDGNTQTESDVTELNKQGEIASPGAWFTGKSVIRTYDIKFENLNRR